MLNKRTSLFLESAKIYSSRIMAKRKRTRDMRQIDTLSVTDSRPITEGTVMREAYVKFIEIDKGADFKDPLQRWAVDIKALDEHVVTTGKLKIFDSVFMMVQGQILNQCEHFVGEYCKFIEGESMRDQEKTLLEHKVEALEAKLEKVRVTAMRAHTAKSSDSDKRQLTTAKQLKTSILDIINSKTQIF